MKYITIQNIVRYVVEPMSFAAFTVVIALLVTFLDGANDGKMVDAGDLLGALLRLYAYVLALTLVLTAASAWFWKGRDKAGHTGTVQ
jgi:hypothetical protein